MQDPIPVRLGGLATNLLRIYSFTLKLDYKKGVEGLLNESKYFIDWTANETEVNVKEFLVELQIQIAYWQYALSKIWKDEIKKKNLATKAKEYSDKVLKLSGLLNG